MALLDERLKQRIVGAVVLLALAAIFLPMLFSREDRPRAVEVQVPAPPAPPSIGAATPAAPTAAPAPADAATVPGSALDTAGLPVSWSVQLAGLSNLERARELQQTLRRQGYNAYLRSAGGLHRVLVGPLIQRAEAERMAAILGKKLKVQPMIVRFQPEAR
ncbi:SPOR domain-containing protein [Pseudomonas sp. NW5]|uniref:SPOR domain-containing protein n=1 Tax=Pseudomonas sp. NW5 TaxID=2934934 RepID=UPI0020221BAE|nr:SPOR domain-containing protein [Pseudomonas sp. NW5]MCL7461731.1 SPOR domain-containing protein [Pseudomonas sp. NW5]